MTCRQLCYFCGRGKIKLSAYSFFVLLTVKIGSHSLYRLCQLIMVWWQKSWFEPTCKASRPSSRKKLFISSVWSSLSQSHVMPKSSIWKDVKGASSWKCLDHTGIKRCSLHYTTISLTLWFLSVMRGWSEHQLKLYFRTIVESNAGFLSGTSYLSMAKYYIGRRLNDILWSCIPQTRLNTLFHCMSWNTNGLSYAFTVSYQ